MPPAARLGDFHVCPMVIPGVPPIPHIGGPITSSSANVFIGGMPAARVGDSCLCPPVGPSDAVAMGSVTVRINGMPAARMGDACAHGGAIVAGCPTVMIADITVPGVGMTSVGVPGKVIAPPMVSPLMRGETMSAGAAQKRALKAASASGVPFCALCEREKVS